MSILIVGVDRGTALAATDSQLIGADANARIAKLYPLPHIGAVVAGRGMGRLAAMVAAEVAVAALGFDDVADRLQQFIERASDELADHISRLPERDRKNEIMLVGWSPKQACPVAHFYVQDRPGEPIDHRVFVPDDKDGRVLCSPWIDELGPVPTLSDLGDDGGVMAVARRQVRLMNQRWAPRSAGGEIICARIFEGGIITRSIGKIDAEG